MGRYPHEKVVPIGIGIVEAGEIDGGHRGGGDEGVEVDRWTGGGGREERRCGENREGLGSFVRGLQSGKPVLFAVVTIATCHQLAEGVQWEGGLARGERSGCASKRK